MAEKPYRGNGNDPTATGTTRERDGFSGDQTRSLGNSDGFLLGVEYDKGSKGGFRILDLSGSETAGNWTKSSKPGLTQGVSTPARFEGKKAVSAVGLNSTGVQHANTSG